MLVHEMCKEKTLHLKLEDKTSEYNLNYALKGRHIELGKSWEIVILVLTIFNEGTFVTFKSIFHEALNLF